MNGHLFLAMWRNLRGLVSEAEAWPMEMVTPTLIPKTIRAVINLTLLAFYNIFQLYYKIPFLLQISYNNPRCEV